MKIHVIIPVKSLPGIKRRLSKSLDADGRKQLSFSMLKDVLAATFSSSTVEEVHVVSPDEEVLSFARRSGATCIKEASERGVNAAVQLGSEFCVKEGAEATLILPSDIPTVKSKDIETMAASGLRSKCVVVAPSGRFDGTNALLLKPPQVIATRYELDSFRSHLNVARAQGIKCKVYVARSVMLDIDTPRDIEALLLKPVKSETISFLKGSVSSGNG